MSIRHSSYHSKLIYLFLLVCFHDCAGQIGWRNLDSAYGDLPPSIHVYFTSQPIDTAPFRAYYLIADLHDRNLHFTADTVRDRRITPQQFFERDSRPLAIVNCTFFSYETNRSLNAVILNGKLVAYNQHSLPGRGKDTLTFSHTIGGAIGINKKRTADVAWLYTDSLRSKALSVQNAIPHLRDSVKKLDYGTAMHMIPATDSFKNTHFRKWKMQVAVGGGPVLIQNGAIRITNNEELRFAGKAINDKHPRTAMGYTSSGKLIILVIEGRNKVAHGATLRQEAEILRDLGCQEAINLDGGGSSCLLINGRETIKPSDSTGQRPVPAVFIIRH